MKKRIGCLTGSGLVSAFITLLIITGLTLAKGNQLFSPGALNSQAGEVLGGVASHAEIGGECKLCHTAPWESATMADRCVSCHINISGQIGELNSLHGIVFRNNPVIACRSCHPEHNGAFAPLTVLKKFNFPHDSFGFSLNKHGMNWDGKPLQCQDCHKSDFYQFEQNSCIACHDLKDVEYMQIHIQNFGPDCLACHDGLETYGKTFDHDDFSFKINGKHADALCAVCHIRARTKQDLQSTPQDCLACHQEDDEHTGRFGSGCGDCHTPDGWKPAKFDHDLANFKLEGKHLPVKCEKCHEDAVYQGTPQECLACHAEDDEHKGVLGTDCGLCHSADGWEPSTFDHALSAYPLTGLHIAVACEKCHIDKIFKGTPTSCVACHAINDKHKGSYGSDCSACHSTGGWYPSTFNHALNRFPLTGAHIGLACTRCHSNFNFQAASTVCASCHREPVFHTGSFSSNCVACHTTTNWNASYSGPHPSFGEHGGINHEGASCRDCHTVNLKTATCTKCHDSNNPGD
jgi:hypothetical protein